MHQTAYLLVNFGGPRSLNEIESFLTALLTDRDVIRTSMPQPFRHFFFRRVAKKRAAKVREDYKLIGGASPIYHDTEWMASALSRRLSATVLTFHRYLPDSHHMSLEAIEKIECDEICVFPLFPQFSYATTGSIARVFLNSLSRDALNRLKWIKSYPTHPAFIQVMQTMIRESLNAYQWREEETTLLFSAHGLPRKFIDEGDIYEHECALSFQKIMTAFPRALGKLSYQSKFGPGEWLRPYTPDLCEDVAMWNDGRKNLLMVPISFTSDHIETLFEMEKLYLPILRHRGINAHRLPALNRRPDWIEAIRAILHDFTPSTTQMLVRRE